MIGANRKSLVFQFIGESLLLSVTAGIIALVLISLVLPAFNQLLNKHIAIDFTNITDVAVFVGIILATGILAGSYPSFVLSAFKPVKVLKSNTDRSSAGNAWVRKTLVVTQFAVSVMLIIGTLVVYNQLNYIKNKSLGYSRENLIWFPNSIAIDKNNTAINEFKKSSRCYQCGTGFHDVHFTKQYGLRCTMAG